MSTTIRSAQDSATWGSALDEAVNAIGRAAVIVLPTDTVYGVGADAFNPAAVKTLLAAKGRGRDMPPPVLVANVATMGALAIDIPAGATKLAEEFWPGGLTLILRAQPALAWDLGDTQGTVALRVPDHPTALALLTRTGPLAVSSANVSGQPAALTAHEAFEQLGNKIALYLDGGEAPGQVSSTIIDATGPRLKVVREGAITLEQLRAITDVAGIEEDVHATADDATADDATEDATTEDAATKGEAAEEGAAEPASAVTAPEPASPPDEREEGAV